MRFWGEQTWSGKPADKAEASARSLKGTAAVPSLQHGAHKPAEITRTPWEWAAPVKRETRQLRDGSSSIPSCSLN